MTSSFCVGTAESGRRMFEDRDDRSIVKYVVVGRDVMLQRRSQGGLGEPAPSLSEKKRKRRKINK